MDRLTGWKEISQFVGFSEKWCQEAAAREVNPLPTYRLGEGKQARVCANPCALRAWEAKLMGSTPEGR